MRHFSEKFCFEPYCFLSQNKKKIKLLEWRTTLIIVLFIFLSVVPAVVTFGQPVYCDNGILKAAVAQSLTGSDPGPNNMFALLSLDAANDQQFRLQAIPIPELSIGWTPDEGGEVEVEQGWACPLDGGPCSPEIVIARPFPGYQFTGWSGTAVDEGRVSGSGARVSVAIDWGDHLTLWAHFEPDVQDTMPPVTTHSFSGTDKARIAVHLTATDDLSGVDVTRYHLELRDGGVERGEGSFCLLNLEKVRKIVYFSVDKVGRREAQHEVEIHRIQAGKSFEQTAYHSDGGFSKFDLFVETICYKIGPVLFIDEINADIDDPDIDIVGIAVQHLGKYVRKRMFNSVLASWDEMGEVDWNGRDQRYRLHVQLLGGYDHTQFLVFKCLTPVSIPLPFPGGLIVINGCSPDTVVGVNVPPNDDVRSEFSSRLLPQEQSRYEVLIDTTTRQASFALSCDGSNLNLTLYSPNGEKICRDTIADHPEINFFESENYQQYDVKQVACGVWTIEVVGGDVPPGGQDYTLTVDLDTPLTLTARASEFPHLNDVVLIIGSLLFDGIPLAEDADVTADVLRPDQTENTIQLLDDGMAADEVAGDGVYSGAYVTTSLSGIYHVRISATGFVDGSIFTREASTSFQVAGAVTFEDPNLKASVEAALGVVDPTSIDMLQLVELTARGRGIYSLSGLEYAMNLTDLDLGSNNIVAIDALAGLSNLSLLHLDNNAISNVDPLSGLTALQALWLDSNQIADIAALAGLMNLQFLELSGNPLNQEACDVYIPQIKADNPSVQIYDSSCVAECTLTVSSTTGGWVRALRGDLMRLVNGTLSYSCGRRVRVSAMPDLDHYFVNWTGTAVTAGKVDNPNSSSTTVTVDGDYTLVANFAPEEPESLQTLGIAIIPSGAGSVTCSPNRLEYPLGERVQVTAIPNEGYVFSHWAGVTQVEDPISATTWLVIEEACHIIANFVPEEPEPLYSLDVAIIPSGAGSVTRSPDKTLYAPGEEVTLTASPADGYAFLYWTPSLVNCLDNPKTIVMDSDKTVYSFFGWTDDTTPLDIRVYPAGSGTVTLSPVKAEYLIGEHVTVTAVPADGYTFERWSGITPVNDPYSATTTTVIEVAFSVIANFKAD